MSLFFWWFFSFYFSIERRLSMNYIYDLVLNFFSVKEDMDFYEWNQKDSILTVSKIPIFCISSFQLQEICHYDCRMDDSFLKQIENQVEGDFGSPFMCLLTDSNRVFAFEWNKDGLLLRKSSLLLDEEDAILEEAEDYSMIFLSYQKGESYPKNEPFLTRKEKKIQFCLLKGIHSLYHSHSYDVIHYLYQEIFSKKVSTKEEYSLLVEEIQNHFSKKYESLYDILMLTQ